MSSTLRESGRTAASAKGADEPLGSEGGFQLVLKHRYFLLIGLLTLAVQIANTNGNYILDETLIESARNVAGYERRAERAPIHRQHSAPRWISTRTFSSR